MGDDWIWGKKQKHKTYPYAAYKKVTLELKTHKE